VTAILSLAQIAVLGIACTVGAGDGWVRGSLWIENCRDGNPLGDALDKPNDFDLKADFYAGEPIEDSDKSIPQKRSSLIVRIQPTSNNPEVSDGLMLQFTDLDLAVQRFASGRPLEITNSGLCSGQSCTNSEDPLRASLYLYTTCPHLRQPLVGSSHVMTMTTSPSSEESCLRHLDETGVAPVPPWTEPCPSLDSAAVDELEMICNSDFNDQSSFDAVGRLLGGGACLYLCRFGEARKGQSEQELKGYHIDYGDRVAGIFSMQIVDGRAVTFQTCANVSGEVRGMFTFEVTRGRAAQSFP
jgi:hypothetical protein